MNNDEKNEKVYNADDVVNMTDYTSTGQVKKYRLELEANGYNFSKKGQATIYRLEDIGILQAMLHVKTESGQTIAETAPNWADWKENQPNPRPVSTSTQKPSNELIQTLITNYDEALRAIGNLNNANINKVINAIVNNPIKVTSTPVVNVAPKVEATLPPEAKALVEQLQINNQQQKEQSQRLSETIETQLTDLRNRLDRSEKEKGIAESNYQLSLDREHATENSRDQLKTKLDAITKQYNATVTRLKSRDEQLKNLQKNSQKTIEENSELKQEVSNNSNSHNKELEEAKQQLIDLKASSISIEDIKKYLDEALTSLPDGFLARNKPHDIENVINDVFSRNVKNW